MRCPKCGFISFDHLDKCLKCNKEIKDADSIVQGTVFNVQAPSFLKIQLEPEKKSFGDIAIDGGLDNEEFDLQDPDLEILLDEEGGEVETTASSMQFDKDAGDVEMPPGDAFELSLDTAREEEDEGIAIDLGQFQNDLDDGTAGFDSIATGKKEEGMANLDFPEELSDISDLSPPHQKAVPPPVRTKSGKAESLDDFDLNLDLDLGGLETEVPPAKKEKKPAAKVAALSLDDIDLSSVAPKKTGGATRKRETDAMDMDEELNFELDLGGLSIHKD